MLTLKNESHQFSLFENLLETESEQIIDINGLYEIIKYGYIKDKIEILRKTKNEQDYKNLKKYSIPAVTLSGIFSKREGPGLLKHSGLIQIDFDNVKNFDLLYHNICGDKYTYLAFKSPGGKGIKVVVKIKRSEKTHSESFSSLQKYYKDKFDIDLDPACRDLPRCMLLSYDPNIYCNPSALVFDKIVITPIRKEKKNVINRKPKSKISYSDDECTVSELATQLIENRIDITDTYDKWWRVGMAIAHSLGEQGRQYFHQISSIYPDYKEEECDKFYSDILAKNKGLITLGTLVHYAKEAGIA